MSIQRDGTKSGLVLDYIEFVRKSFFWVFYHSIFFDAYDTIKVYQTEQGRKLQFFT